MVIAFPFWPPPIPRSFLKKEFVFFGEKGEGGFLFLNWFVFFWGPFQLGGGGLFKKKQNLLFFSRSMIIFIQFWDRFLGKGPQ